MNMLYFVIIMWYFVFRTAMKSEYLLFTLDIERKKEHFDFSFTVQYVQYKTTSMDQKSRQFF